MRNIIKIHFTHKQRIRSLFREGFCLEELALMYKTQYATVKEIVRGITPPERI